MILFQRHEISIGAAAELAGMDLYTFMTSCGQHGIPVIDYPVEDSEAEIEAIRKGEL